MNASSLQDSGTHLYVTVPLPDGFEESQAWLQQRIALCLTRSWPHVASLREAHWSDDGGSVELVYNVRGERLCDYLDRVRGESRKHALDQLPAQLLLALHSLHADGIAHGDLCADAIYVDEREDGKLDFQIMHLATGGATARFGQAILPGVPCNEPAYWPPEAKDVRLEATPEGDMYALGIVLLESLRGKAAVKTLLSADGEVPARLAMAWPRPEGAQGAALRDLVASLVQDKAQRPTAERAYATWAKERHQSTWERKVSRRALEVALAVTGGICLLLLLGYYMRGAEIQALKGEVTALQSDNKRLEADNKSLKGQVSNLTEQRDKSERTILGLRAANTELDTRIHQLEAELAKCRNEELPPPSPQVLAERVWTENANGGSIPEHIVQELRQTDPAAATLVDYWTGQLKLLKGNVKYWEEKDRDLRDRLGEAYSTPWDGIPKIRERLKHLRNALEVWKIAINNDSLPEFRRVVGLAGGHGNKVKEILAKWESDISNKKVWTIRVTRGVGPMNAGTTRDIRIQTTQDTKDAGAHDWKAPNLHVFQPPLEFTVRWKPGESVSVTLYGERSSVTGLRSTLIHAPFNGPMAMWRLYQYGGVRNGGWNLYFEVVDCPGPPREVLKPVPIPLGP